MLPLFAAVLIASFLGSLHCVGMCGPFAIWATHGGPLRTSVAAYHTGRLTTYLSVGLMAGVLGSLVEVGGNLSGFQSVAAKLAGGALVLIGVWKLLALTPIIRRRARAQVKPSVVASALQYLKPMVNGRGPFGRAYLVGLLTTWLPCGWLYLFALIAAGTGAIAPAMLVMAAFWVGSLPALSGLALGARQLIPRFQSSLPIIAGVMLVVTGLYTATGRASADFSTLVAPRLEAVPSPDALIGLTDETLPCCIP